MSNDLYYFRLGLGVLLLAPSVLRLMLTKGGRLGRFLALLAALGGISGMYHHDPEWGPLVAIIYIGLLLILAWLNPWMMKSLSYPFRVIKGAFITIKKKADQLAAVADNKS